MERKATYRMMSILLHNALGDLRMLAGDEVGPSDSTWQDIAGTAVVNLRALADLIEQPRERVLSSALYGIHSLMEESMVEQAVSDALDILRTGAQMFLEGSINGIELANLADRFRAVNAEWESRPETDWQRIEDNRLYEKRERP